MPTEASRRRFLQVAPFVCGAAWFQPEVQAEAPKHNPAAALELPWTDDLAWGHVVDITTFSRDALYWDETLRLAQSLLPDSGGVIYFPAGQYRFRESIRLNDGVVLRGAEPRAFATAHSPVYRLGTRLAFPRYESKQNGEGTPTSEAFKGIYLQNPARGANCAVVNIDINRGHIHFGEADDHECGANRMVYGCILRNAAVADPAVPDVKAGQHAWQRFTHRHHAAIDVKGAANILVANNRLPQSGDDNFTMTDYVLKPTRSGPDRYDGVVFDYDNRPGIYVCHHCIGGSGGSGNDGTPETHPFGFRKGIVIRDNYVFNSGRMAIGFSGDGTLCANNVVRFAKDVWRPTNTGRTATSGSSTNDNRAIEMRGWRWTVEGTDYEVHRNWAADKKYLLNDGEGLMHEDHCNSEVRDSRLINNTGNSYLSIYKCGPINGLEVRGNDVSTLGKIADVFVVADRNSGPQPCRNVQIVENTTRSNGIHVAGTPASNNMVRGNKHVGTGGVIRNEADAKVSGNEGYQA